MSDVLITSQAQIDAHRATASTYLSKLQNQREAYQKIISKVEESWSGKQSEKMRDHLNVAVQNLTNMIDDTKPVVALMDSCLNTFEKNL